MKPKQIVEKWVEAFNRSDVDTISELYAEQAVNHQNGKQAIKQMFSEEFANANMTCIVENLFEDGEWAILEWKDPLGLRGCGFFQVVVGKIHFQRGYWDKLSFLRQHKLSIPEE